jgi:ankyrin repeat protein
MSKDLLRDCRMMQESDAFKDAFFEVAEAGDLPSVTGLLESHTDLLHAKNQNGQTALFAAIFGGNFDCVKVLIDRGIDIHSADNRGWTALHEAAYNGTPEIAELLLSCGADIHARDRYGFTPLYWPIVDGREDFIQLLLDHGADPLLKDNTNKNSLDWAKLGRNEKKIAKLLRQYCKGKYKSNRMGEET